MGASMMTITAIIRAKKGHEATMRRALLHVADHVRINEPSTVGFFVSQDASDPCVFTTYERFADQAAMDRHNGSDAVARSLKSLSRSSTAMSPSPPPRKFPRSEAGRVVGNAARRMRATIA